MKRKTEAWVGLGSNLDEPAKQVRAALHSLRELDRTRFRVASALYGSTPMGPREQPTFVNAVAGLETGLSPHELLDALQGIENAAGRSRAGARWGPRTLDLDLLLYGDQVVHDERLVVPHPGLTERAFVLIPLASVAPRLPVPGRGRVDELAAALQGDDVWRLSEEPVV